MYICICQCTYTYGLCLSLPAAQANEAEAFRDHPSRSNGSEFGCFEYLCQRVGSFCLDFQIVVVQAMIGWSLV